MKTTTKNGLNIAAHVACICLSIVALFIGTRAMHAGVPSSTQAQAPAVIPSALVDLTEAAESSVNSVVYIKVTMNGKTQTVEYSNPFEDFFDDFFGGGGNGSQRRQVQTPKRQGSGSGVIISEDGYIVTNNHVVGEADEIEVKLNDNKEYKARIIGTDSQTDLALIKIEAKGLQAIKIGNSDDLKLGEWVLAVGNPFNLTSTVTAGIVSAKARQLGATKTGIESFIQTDAAINQGNSGGALVNARGELVGINAMLYSNTGSYSGYGFAIPTTIMNKVVDDFKKFGSVQRALLGIAGADVTNYLDRQKEAGKEEDLGTNEGVYVDEVSSDGAASEAGLQHGDVVIAIDGKKITKMSELQEEITKHHPGDKVEVTYLRDKKTQKKTVTLRNAQGTTEAISEVDPNSLGVSLKPITEDMKRQLALKYGLYVAQITNGKMKEAGVTKGVIILQVNDKQMNTVADFDEVVKQANMSKDRVLWVRAKTQSGRPLSYTIELCESKE